MSIINHLSLWVSDDERSKKFYEAALAPLGIKLMMEFGSASGFGIRKPAFVAKNRGSVDAFFAAAMAVGGKDFGGPGLRPEYHPNYYGAFVIDPDGHNVEAVFHGAA